MEDMHASKSGKEEITDGGDNRSLLNLEAEKLVDDEAMEFQSPNASITQEPTGMESYRAGTCEAHGKKPNKKPNKPLPCPRCESFDTKFCYFNNYNINQPRHFCRKCQRYWTAGGSLRNVTTGAGRRRSKSNTTHPKHGVLSDAKALGCNTYNMAKGDAKADLLRAQTVLATLDAGQLVSEDGLSTSSTMLSFGQEKAENVSLSLRIGNTERDCPVKQDEKGVNLGLNHNFDIAKDNLTSTSTWHGLPGAMWSHPPWLLVRPGPLSLDWANAYWHMPSFLAAVASSSSSMQSHGLQAGRPENKGDLLTPKTLRINDPVEAAQSSIWKTLGLDKAPGSSASKEGIKKASQLEAGTQTEKESSSPSQHCNPAALSRSLTFNKTS